MALHASCAATIIRSGHRNQALDTRDQSGLQVCDPRLSSECDVSISVLRADVL